MLAAKRLALRPCVMKKSDGARPWVPVLCAVVLLAGPGPAARADRLALPAEEQIAVNRAIDRGVRYLQLTQLRNGTWAQPQAGHQVGYAVLPGLTLLECGVPATDPGVQSAARFLRRNAAKLDTTYELSLGLLFLDRLGDPRDKALIQTFALRLIAGQSATGGWGYKCPVLPGPIHVDLLTALRHLNPPAPLPAVARDPAGMPGVATVPGRKPGDLGGIATGPDRKPGDLAPVAGPTNPPLSGTPAGEGPGTSPSRSPGASTYPSAAPPAEPTLWRTWLGFSNTPGGEIPKPRGPANPDPADKRADKGPPPAPPDAGAPNPGAPNPPAGKPAPPAGKPYVVPLRLKAFPVLQDPELQVLQDPKDQGNEWRAPTTDNSNTQFALLALWVAQRHGVPMDRTLKLIVRRFETSQNGDGSWGYHYRFGGNEPERPPMTCVGLLGLAVGHGIAREGEGLPANAGQPVRDPRILNGLVAMSKNVGKPAGKLADLPMANLYHLWSVERVAVLYNLTTIGDKDWYRWGAEILVANQALDGNWKDGGYYGASPAIDTCLALLFLKRANLVRDLTARLPFKPADINQDVMQKLTPPPPAPKPPEKIDKTLSAEPPKPAPPPEDNLITKPLGPTEQTAAPTRAEEADVVPTGDGGNRKKWAAVLITAFLLLGGGSLFFFLLGDKKEKKDRQPRTSAGKRKRKTAVSSRDGDA